MMPLREFWTRMQSQATRCVAVLLVDLRDGRVLESCADGAGTNFEAVGRVMRDLAAQAADVPHETILLSEERTYVWRCLEDPPHHAVTAICEGTQSLGLVISLLNHALATALAKERA